MSNNVKETVTIDLAHYNNLRDFKKTYIEGDVIKIGGEYWGRKTKYITKDEAVTKLGKLAQSFEEENDKLEKKNSSLKRKNERLTKENEELVKIKNRYDSDVEKIKNLPFKTKLKILFKIN